jgi:hypothetical protein
LLIKLGKHISKCEILFSIINANKLSNIFFPHVLPNLIYNTDQQYKIKELGFKKKVLWSTFQVSDFWGKKRQKTNTLQTKEKDKAR